MPRDDHGTRLRWRWELDAVHQEVFGRPRALPVSWDGQSSMEPQMSKCWCVPDELRIPAGYTCFDDEGQLAVLRGGQAISGYHAVH